MAKATCRSTNPAPAAPRENPLPDQAETSPLAAEEMQQTLDTVADTAGIVLVMQTLIGLLDAGHVKVEPGLLHGMHLLAGCMAEHVALLGTRTRALIEEIAKAVREGGGEAEPSEGAR